MRRLLIASIIALLAGCGSGVREDPTEPRLQLVPATTFPVQRTIGLQVIAQGTVKDVQLFHDGKPVTALVPPEYAYVWDAGNDEEGTYQLWATARTAFGTAISSNRVAVVVDRTSPQVISYAPQAGSDKVALKDGFTFAFSEPVLRASLSPATVAVFRDGSAVDVQLTLARDGKTLSVLPATLVKGAYRLHLSGDITDLAGNALRPLDADPVWQNAIAPPGPVTAARILPFTDTARVQWSPPADDGGDPIWFYNVTQVGLGQSVATSDVLYDFGPLAVGAEVTYDVFAVTRFGSGPVTRVSAIMPPYAGTLYTGQAAVTLDSGKVLIAGASTQTRDDLCCALPTPAFAALYDPATNQMQARIPGWDLLAETFAAKLLDGRVLVAGGHGGLGYMTSAAIYDPGTNSFFPTGSLASPLCCGRSSTLAGGQVLVGRTPFLSEFLGPPLEMYDPSTGMFHEIRSGLEPELATLFTALPDGRAMLVGCLGCSAERQMTALMLLPGPQGTWSLSGVGFLHSSHAGGTATVLADGRVLFAGGTQYFWGSGDPRSCEIFDPAKLSFTPVADLRVGRIAHTATLLADGRVLFLGGTADGLDSAEIYDPVNGGVPTADLACARGGHTASPIPGNKLLLLGGKHRPVPGTCPEEIYALP